MKAIRYRIAEARKLCGCYACCGLRDIGEHTIIGGKPRITPSSCLAAQVFQELSTPERPTEQSVDRARLEAWYRIMAIQAVGKSSET